MHVLDYDRALGELLELDDTIRATIACMFFPPPPPTYILMNL